MNKPPRMLILCALVACGCEATMMATAPVHDAAARDSSPPPAPDAGDRSANVDASAADGRFDAGALPAPAPSGPVRGLFIGGNWWTTREYDAMRELVPELERRGANTLAFSVNWNFEFASDPSCSESDGNLTRAQAVELGALARAHRIHLVPSMELLGHQWRGRGVLRCHPELDETPEDTGDDLRSFCPSAPDSARIVLALADEVVDAFGADTIHIGLDEVQHIGLDERCRATGKTNARIFADWVSTLVRHFRERGVRVWMWGDRLLPPSWYDGYWESSATDTWQEIDAIEGRDWITVTDWHYGFRDGSSEPPFYPSLSFFAEHGFGGVVASPWRDLDATQAFVRYAEGLAASTPAIRGVVATQWGGPARITDYLLGRVPPECEGLADTDPQYGRCDDSRLAAESLSWVLGGAR